MRSPAPAPQPLLRTSVGSRLPPYAQLRDPSAVHRTIQHVGSWTSARDHQPRSEQMQRDDAFDLAGRQRGPFDALERATGEAGAHAFIAGAILAHDRRAGADAKPDLAAPEAVMQPGGQAQAEVPVVECPRFR